jgi:hypothetical protein
MIPLKSDHVVLSIYPRRRGFAFVLFEGAFSPVDWRIADIRKLDWHNHCLRRIDALCARYEPDALVLQDTSHAGTRRLQRIVELNAGIAELGERCGIPVFGYSRQHVREAFAHLGTTNKYAIAEAIAKHIPAFERYLPRARKPWMSEDERMDLFDAAALGWVFFSSAQA